PDRLLEGDRGLLAARGERDHAARSPAAAAERERLDEPRALERAEVALESARTDLDGDGEALRRLRALDRELVDDLLRAGTLGIHGLPPLPRRGERLLRFAIRELRLEVLH